jgi:hypothetical protein
VTFIQYELLLRFTLIGQEWGLMSVILVTQEVKAGGSQFKVSPGKKLAKPNLNNNKKAGCGATSL